MSALVEIARLQKALLNELLISTRQVMLLRKVDSRSDLVRSTEWTFEKNQFTLLANYYFEYVDGGRPPMTRKKVPVDALIKWMRKNNIRPVAGQTYTSLAFAIQKSIHKIGIKPKQFSQSIIDESMEIILNRVSAELTAEIIKRVIETLEINN